MDERELLQLNGAVKGVLYRNEENGYAVVRVEDENGQTVTAVGCLPFAAPGEELELAGHWERHPSHGEQFRVVRVRRSLPVRAEAIYEFLASRPVKGIGPATASLLVTRFGDRTLEVLSEHPEELASVRGISRKKAREFSEEFRRQAGLRLLMEFLSNHGLRPEYAMRLYRLYGDGALTLLKANPYLLSSDRVGGRFDEADALALSMGFEGDSPERVAAALLFEMRHNLNNGHSFLPREKLLDATAKLIDVPRESCEDCLEALSEAGEIRCETVSGEEACYLERLYEAECHTARRLGEMASRTLRCRLDTEALLSRLEKESGLEYAPLQRRAVEMAGTRQLLALTGGPGTGKTTVVRAILALYDALGLRCLLAAPTGRAAKRMSELTGREAATVHRLLGAGYAPQGDELSFRKNADDLLECEALVLDECSMVDVSLMSSLLAALPREARLVLVGDADQLPSVGPGCVFQDVLRSGAVATLRLTEIFRQGEDSRIVSYAHAINAGDCPDLRENRGDFFFLRRPDPYRAAETAVELCAERLPRNMGIPSQEIQVLTPTRRRDCGSAALNQRLQDVLNPPAPEKRERRIGDKLFREGDRVMQIRNNYDVLWFSRRPEEGVSGAAGSGVYNGDVGYLESIDEEAELAWVDFDGRKAAYAFDQMGELEPAWAMTVHKSQGSEFRAVVLVLGADASPRLLSRGVLYTAVTRASELLVVVGDEAAFRHMVLNASQTRRYSGLRARLAGEAPA